MGEEKMTIKTLELIHDMLEHELDAVRNEVRVIRKGLNEKYPEDWDKNDPLYTIYSSAREREDRVQYALDEFEHQDF